MTQQEFNKRCNDVFDTQEGEEYYSIHIVENKYVVINMSETDNKGNMVVFDYCPNMIERPQALDYLLGKRDDFND